MQTSTTRTSLVGFVRESNRIEGILREPTTEELHAHEKFLSEFPTVKGLTDFVSEIQYGATLRDRSGLNVVVGKYFPPSGGTHILDELQRILSDMRDPFITHQRYEALHPFTDGNGRSGRVLWLWMMGGVAGAPLGFLHHWYYQSLQSYCHVR